MTIEMIQLYNEADLISFKVCDGMAKAIYKHGYPECLEDFADEKFINVKPNQTSCAGGAFSGGGGLQVGNSCYYLA